MVSPHRAPSLPGLSVGEGATSPSPLATSGSPVAPAAPAPTSPLLVSQNPLAAPPPEPGAARSRTPILVGGGLLVLVAAGLIARSLGPAAEVELSVSSSAGDAVATVRGQQYPLPSKIRVKRQSDPEMVEVRARGFDERRFWVTVDHDLTLLAELNRSAPPAALPAVPPTGSAAAPVAPVPPSPTAPTAAPAAPAAAPPAAAPAVAAVAAPARPAPSEPAPRSAASTSVVPRGAPGPAAPGRPAVATPAAPSGPTAAPAAEPRPAAAHNEPVPSPSPAPIAAAPAPAPAPPPVVAAPPAAPAPSPVPVPAAPAVVPLAAAAFSQQLSAHRAAVDACIAEDPSVSGRMTVRVAVRRDGSVESAAAESGATPAVRSCVVKQVRTWRFPAGEARAEGRFPIELD